MAFAKVFLFYKTVIVTPDLFRGGITFEKKCPAKPSILITSHCLLFTKTPLEIIWTVEHVRHEFGDERFVGFFAKDGLLH